MSTLRKLIKRIDEKTTKKPDYATVHAVDGNRIDVRLRGSSTVIRNVEVAGGTSGIEPGDVVPIFWVNNRPLAMVNSKVDAVTQTSTDYTSLTKSEVENLAAKLEPYMRITTPTADLGIPVIDQVADQLPTSEAHDHNDLYYTEAEIDAQYAAIFSMLSGKADESHTHSYLPLWGGVLQGTLDMGNNVITNLNETWASNGSATDPSYTFADDQDTGGYLYGQDQYGIATGGVCKAMFGTSQNNFYQLLNMASNRITALADGTGSTDAVNKGQLDGHNHSGVYANYSHTHSYTDRNFGVTLTVGNGLSVISDDMWVTAVVPYNCTFTYLRVTGDGNINGRYYFQFADTNPNFTDHYNNTMNSWDSGLINMADKYLAAGKVIRFYIDPWTGTTAKNISMTLYLVKAS